MRVNPEPHGLSSNADWNLLAADDHHVSLRLDYPGTSDIQFLTRRVSADPDALDLELEIRARRPTRLPIGLHLLAASGIRVNLAVQAFSARA
jgi:hypothetical protein